MDDKTPRRYWQFSVRTLLWLMLCIAIGFGAYRTGFENGYSDHLNQRQEVGKTFAASYDVSDVIPCRKTNTAVIVDFDPLINDVTKSVLPNTWEKNGGEASVAEFATNLSLVVSHDKDGHERVAVYLEELRRKKNENQGIALKQ
ncbi:MAG: hypothetical protein IAF94_10155 [Pirellulaceae bacterium]|nr:hypothetical protein [Pirellulaceae bacterium]